MSRAAYRGSLQSLVVLFVLTISSFFASAQEVGEYYHDVTTKEWNFDLFVNTSGLGVGFQHGRTPDLWNKHFWEVEMLYNKHPKSVRSINVLYDGVRPCRYGQLYTLFFLQGGYGFQRTLHQKPYWGGVQIRYTLSAGPCLAMAIPNYVEIINYNTGFSEIVRYDPEKHDLNNILGGAGMFYGIFQTTFRPGFYGKTGINFEFSRGDYSLQALEIGLSVNMVFPFLQQMAFNEPKKAYLCAYLSYCIGRKQGIH